MDNDDRDKDELQKQLDELEEWQNNAFNPGYYVGNGKIPLPVKNLRKFPILLLIIAVPTLVGIIISIVDTLRSGGSILINLFSYLIPGIISVLLTIRGVTELWRKKK
ncbi:hypothetical protein SAMN02746089_02688 [Caldanaerobius fijiensis DSM 17918]|uniref:Uncharacterized protein n=1 Tax=Caldanaerobius fijiensis DSM 17918 TaxID=1121256 RepID=A0A1M5F5C7_9THEO|nr:hypothetical protein [Caldanaerobius fijiensis]SHF86749.1 hypothetical protein SAMN02746089_02688 [Caldanaerobius fijiensis DSM 17918]